MNYVALGRRHKIEYMPKIEYLSPPKTKIGLKTVNAEAKQCYC